MLSCLFGGFAARQVADVIAPCDGADGRSVMTIILGMPEVLSALLPFVQPVVLAIASACGAGLLVRIGLDVGLTLARQALANRA